MHTVNERTAEGDATRPGGRLLATLFPELSDGSTPRGTELLTDALAFGIALLFSRTHLFFGMYPFALSYLAAARRRIVPIALGAAVGAAALPTVGPVFTAATCLLLLFRLIFSLPVGRRVLFPVTRAVFTESPILRTLAAALTGSALAAYELAVSGPHLYTLYFAALAILSPSVLTFLFTPILDSGLSPTALVGRGQVTGWEPGRVRPALLELSLLSLLLSLVLATASLSLFGLSLSALVTVGATLLCARRLGAARAGVLGLLAGLVARATTAPAFAILGLVAGFLFPYGVLYGALGGMAAALVFSGYAEGLSGFLAVAPEGAVAVLLLMPVLRGTEALADPAAHELHRRRLAAATAEAAKKPPEGQERLARLGVAFSALSGMFYRLSDEERRPQAAEYFMECQKVCARFCATCSNRVRCWEQGDRMAERAAWGLATRLHEAGRVSGADLLPELRNTCPRTEEILDGIRDECAAMAMRRHRGDRNEFLSFDYAMLSRLLAEAAAADREETVPDREATRRLTEALGDDALHAAVFGNRRPRVAVGALSEATLTERQSALKEAAEAAVGCALSAPVSATCDGVATLTMQAERRFAVRCASASVPLVGSGDRLRFFEAADDFQYAVLSDGMGSGEEAAAVATVCVEFLETMLTAGTGRAAALRMLNNLIRTRTAECSATVDMLVFDLLHGHAAFFKSGAAPSYIKRGGEILRVRSHTMPIGTGRTPDTERVNVEVAVGDVLVLCSDGLVGDGEEPAWLLSLLSEEATDDLDALATRIIAEAVSRIPEPRDDITVGLVAIEAL